MRRLAELGLRQRSVQRCFGVGCVAHALGAPPPASDRWLPAAVLPRLFVAGNAAPAAVARRHLGDLLDELANLRLIACDRDRVRAAIVLLPVGEALAVCGPTPDDSTFHLIGALPRRRVARWLDVGTGNAIVPLARRGLATRVVGCDIDAEAIACARAGALLSGARELALCRADLLRPVNSGPPWPLITFNAPIPAPGGPDLLTEFWEEAPRLLAGSGEAIVHSVQPLHDYPARLQLPGLTVAVRYTPLGVEPAFGVTLWRPRGPVRSELVHVRLTAEHPHIARAHFHLDTSH